MTGEWTTLTETTSVIRVTLTPSEAAEAIGIGARTLLDWTLAGFVPSIKRGRIRLYSVRALERWAEEASRLEGRRDTQAMGDGVGLQAPFGRKMGRGRQRAPTPIRGDGAGGAPDAR